VHAVKAKGKDYYYFQPYRGSAREAGRVRLPGGPFEADGTPNPAWWQAYRELSGEERKGPGAGSFAALIAAYKESPEWSELSPKTQGLWKPLLGKIEQAWGGLSVKGLEARHVLALRDIHAETPGMANNLIRALSSLIAWSVPRGWRNSNPCAGLRKLKGGEGYEPWSWDEIELLQAIARRDIWFAAALALYTGQRLNDVLRMRWSDIKGGLIAVVQQKTGKQLWIPAHENLRQVLEQVPRSHVNILTNSRKAAWTVDGFKTSWGDELDRPEFADLRRNRRVFHGLRKSAVVFLLEAGCTDAEVSAITGQSRRMVEHYARQANQKKLAAAAVLKWEASAYPVPKEESGQLQE
jgi:integrase